MTRRAARRSLPARLAALEARPGAQPPLRVLRQENGETPEAFRQRAEREQAAWPGASFVHVIRRFVAPRADEADDEAREGR